MFIMKSQRAYWIKSIFTALDFIVTITDTQVFPYFSKGEELYSAELTAST